MIRYARHAVTCATACLCMRIGSTCFAQVVVNEVHYRPVRPVSSAGETATRLQFVELYNTGATAANLSGWSLTASIRLKFPNGTTIAPSEYLVVAEDPAFLRAHGPPIPVGVRVMRWDSGDLAAGRVKLLDATKGQGQLVDEVTFTNPMPRSWFRSNGGGSSLELMNPRIDNGPATAWQSSTALNGTPGAPNSTLATVLSMPDDAQGGPAAVVEVPISAAPGDGIFGIDMTLQYDASVVQAQSVTVAGIAATAGFTVVSNLNTPGTIIISTFGSQDALTGAGEIARIQFQVVGAPSSSSNLTFASCSINEGGISVTLDAGLFGVTCAGAANGTACNDGIACTTDDACQSDACAGGVTLEVPTEIANLLLVAETSTLSWDSGIAAGPGTVHDVARGLVSQFPIGAGAAESCFASGIAANTITDSSIPPESDGYWYLARARNVCGTGTYGYSGVNGAAGAERITSTCP
jgi:Lamin Tail Domain/Cohesin domain